MERFFTLKKRVNSLIGGKRVHETTILPTILDGVTADMDIATNLEIFGPVFPIMSFSTFNESIKLSNATEFGLQNCVISRSMNTCMAAAKLLESSGAL